MAPTLRFNKEGSKDIFYRIQQPSSGTRALNPIDDPIVAFLAGACHEKLPTQDFKPEDQKSIVEDHSFWHPSQPPSPLISTTADEEWALHLADVMLKYNKNLTLDQIHIAVICPGLVAPGKMEYYHWEDLEKGLGAEIVKPSKNNHEYVFLRRIPREAIQSYETVREYKIRVHEAKMEAIRRCISSLALNRNNREKEAEDAEEQATDGTDTVADQGTGAHKAAEKDREAEEEIAQADHVEADVGGEEKDTDEEQNTVKICKGQKEEGDRNAVGTSNPPVERPSETPLHL